MLLYLRIVHSLDYYSAIEYPDEDKMPNRCGIMHARAALPTEPVNPTEGMLDSHCNVLSAEWGVGERRFLTVGAEDHCTRCI